MCTDGRADGRGEMMSGGSVRLEGSQGRQGSE